MPGVLYCHQKRGHTPLRCSYLSHNPHQYRLCRTVTKKTKATQRQTLPAVVSCTAVSLGTTEAARASFTGTATPDLAMVLVTTINCGAISPRSFSPVTFETSGDARAVRHQADTNEIPWRHANGPAIERAWLACAFSLHRV